MRKKRGRRQNMDPSPNKSFPSDMTIPGKEVNLNPTMAVPGKRENISPFSVSPFPVLVQWTSEGKDKH